ncbi:hypothetical protein M7I_5288 [Glarea lozoyensis 74030]|uniref:Uncharacterized protein n=1 Tax=Glarea lozoyensis (strain ATCC 74030 / MF5533) TaxID=1104152 RepID=H0ERG9_GLAL7|nr:hypothetical protein M7I_5288 [Glarea lozoyensis 74030]
MDVVEGGVEIVEWYRVHIMDDSRVAQQGISIFWVGNILNCVRNIRNPIRNLVRCTRSIVNRIRNLDRYHMADIEPLSIQQAAGMGRKACWREMQRTLFISRYEETAFLGGRYGDEIAGDEMCEMYFVSGFWLGGSVCTRVKYDRRCGSLGNELVKKSMSDVS